MGRNLPDELNRLNLIVLITLSSDSNRPIWVHTTLDFPLTSLFKKIVKGTLRFPGLVSCKTVICQNRVLYLYDL
jgi:hypothetical protein